MMMQTYLSGRWSVTCRFKDQNAPGLFSAQSFSVLPPLAVSQSGASCLDCCFLEWINSSNSLIISNITDKAPPCQKSEAPPVLGDREIFMPSTIFKHGLQRPLVSKRDRRRSALEVEVGPHTGWSRRPRAPQDPAESRARCKGLRCCFFVLKIWWAGPRCYKKKCVKLQELDDDTELLVKMGADEGGKHTVVHFCCFLLYLILLLLFGWLLEIIIILKFKCKRFVYGHSFKVYKVKLIEPDILNNHQRVGCVFNRCCPF